MYLLPLLAMVAALAGDIPWNPQLAVAVDSYNRGIEALNQGDPVEAERWFRKALRKEPACGLCADALASSLLRQDRAVEAIDLAVALRERFPEQPSPAITLADATFAAGRFEESITVSEQLLLAHPESWNSLRLLVRGLLRAGDTTRARVALQQASEHHSPEQLACELGKVAIEEGQLEEARQHLDRCRRSDNPAAVSALESRFHLLDGGGSDVDDALAKDADPKLRAVLEANRMLAAGEVEALVERLRAARTAGDLYPETALILGLCEYELGNTEQAIQALEAVFEGETWISVGRDGGLSGVLTANAERAYEENIRMGVARLVMLQAEVGRLTDAQATLARGVTQLGASGELAAAEAYLLAAQERYPEAAEAVVGGLERWPGSSLLISTATFLATNFQQARTPELDRALADAGEWRSLYNGAAELFNAQEYEACSSRIEAAPSFADPLGQRQLAELAYACGSSAMDLAACERWLEPAGGAAGVPPGARYNHALALLRAGRDEQALALLRAAPAPDDDDTLGVPYRSLELEILARRGEIEAALAVLARGQVDALGRSNLGILLYNARRDEEALPLLRSACPELEDTREQARCRELLSELEAAGR
jgi:tetratricopeptide (TPR) repeat protein